MEESPNGRQDLDHGDHRGGALEPEQVSAAQTPAEYLGVRETAERLGVHENTVRNWVRAGVLASAKVPGSPHHRFRAADVEALLEDRRRSEMPSARERSVIGPELVDATQLSQWADRLESRPLFPELVRRLLAATPGVTNISMRAGDGSEVPGWDGQAESTGTQFLPAGSLRFELGTGARPKIKADSDYRKRATEYADTASELTFVMVTLRRWRGAKTWEEERRAENVFADIRVLDADDLEAWLTEAPSVHHWISERLGRRPAEAMTLRRWWDRFSERTHPPLPGSLFLAGRDDDCDALLDRIAGEPVVTVIASRWRDDGMAFIAAALEATAEGETSVDAETPTWRANPPLVVQSPATWNRLAREAGPAPLIPLFEEPDVQLAVRSGHHVIVPISHEESFGQATIDLPRVSRESAEERLEKALEEVELPTDKASRLAGLARRSMPSLIRQLARDPLFKRPPWSRAPASTILAPLALIGGWTASEDDRAVVTEISGYTADEIEKELLRWKDTSDAPFISAGERWYVASREDSLHLLREQLTREQLERWYEATINVLLELDPTLELPSDERHTAALRGVERRLSTALRGGLAEGITALGSDEKTKLADGRTGAEHAARLVRELTRRANADNTGRIWASLADELSGLAEAAPDAFLDAVIDDLGRDDPILAKMFQDGDEKYSALFASSPHTNLLWALEVLAWSPEHFPTATAALAGLADIDPGGKLGNRPLRSLSAILVGWLHQTAAPLSLRMQAIDNICRRHPDVAWDLVKSLWPSSHAVVSPPSQPHFHDWTPRTRNVTTREWLEFIDHIVARAIELAHEQPNRWAELVTHFGPLPAATRERMVGDLEQALTDDLDEEARAAVWEALRTEITHHRAHPDADWALSDEALQKLEHVATEIAPAESGRRVRHLFDYHPEGEGLDHSDFEQYQTAVRERRIEALKQVVDERGLEGVAELARAAEAKGLIGSLLSTTWPAQHEGELLAWLAGEDADLTAAAYGWAAEEVGRGGLARLGALVARVDDAETKATLAFGLEPGPEVWEFIAMQPSEVRDSYWQRTQPIRAEHADLPYAVEQLLAHRRVWGALRLLAASLHRRDDEDRPFAPQLAIDVIEATMAIEASDEPAANMAGYEIGVLFDYLEKFPELRAQLARLEFIYFEALDHFRTPTALYEELGRTPDLFIELVKMVYRGASEKKRDLDEREVGLAQTAWHVLHEWNRVPGLEEDGAIDAAHLQMWVKDARFAFSESDRTDIGDEQIGCLLAHAPPDAEGIWPPEPVRELIEQLGSSNLETGVAMGRINSRGITSRGVYDGGTQERELASRYREWARATAGRWPRTNRLLRGLAEDYERDARREDERAALRADLE